jgi:hypothetical protein
MLSYLRIINLTWLLYVIFSNSKAWWGNILVLGSFRVARTAKGSFLNFSLTKLWNKPVFINDGECCAASFETVFALMLHRLTGQWPKTYSRVSSKFHPSEETFQFWLKIRKFSSGFDWILTEHHHRYLYAQKHASKEGLLSQVEQIWSRNTLDALMTPIDSISRHWLAVIIFKALKTFI